MKERFVGLVIVLICALGYSSAALAADVFSICDGCSAAQKNARAGQLIDGNDATVVYIGDIETRTVTRHIVLIMDTWRGPRYRYRTSTVPSGSSIYNDYDDLWKLVDRVFQSITIPSSIANSPWDAYFDVHVADQVIDYYSHTWNIDLEHVADIVSLTFASFFGGYSARVYFEDGGYLVLTSDGFFIHDDGFLEVKLEIDWESSRDGAGNQITWESGINETGSIRDNNGFGSAGLTTVTINGIYDLGSSVAQCTVMITKDEVIIRCRKP